MANETGKAIFARLRDTRYVSKYFVGHGIDIGAGPDPLGMYAEFFPLMKSCQNWDKENGDAGEMSTVRSNFFDFVHSSHCLEHMQYPHNALKNWWRILRPGGHMIIIVPDEDLYEQGVFPSTWNADHKWTFTIYKERSWSSKSLNLLDLIMTLDKPRVKKIELCDSTYFYRPELLDPKLKGVRADQTQTYVSESSIELVVEKGK